MVYSARTGDYKFPGGGVNSGETGEQALVREVREECGATVSLIQKAFGKVVEYDVARESEYDLFIMTSLYYVCQIDDALGEQQLEQYEEELGFKPVWVNIDEAIRGNQLALHNGAYELPRWIERETFMLAKIKERLLPFHC